MLGALKLDGLARLELERLTVYGIVRGPDARLLLLGLDRRRLWMLDPFCTIGRERDAAEADSRADGQGFSAAHRLFRSLLVPYVLQADP